MLYISPEFIIMHFFDWNCTKFRNIILIKRSAENGKRGWSSATNLAKDDSKGNSESSYASAGWTSLMDLSAIDNEEERLEGIYFLFND